tara:strand:+ start:33 stop:287 length:255 start_codon:yes stop_codon:yes gene_type:complete
MFSDCKVPVIFAYILTAYFITSIIYLIVSRWLGTPFKDELNKPDYKNLKSIKEKSARNRGILFWSGIIASVIILYIWRPFQNCK